MSNNLFQGEMIFCSMDDEKNLWVRLHLINDKKTRNNSIFKLAEKQVASFGNMPILYAGLRGDNASHNFEEKRDENGQPYASILGADCEKMIGWVYDKLDDKQNPHIENIDGTNWVVADAVLPKFYNKEFIDEFAKNGNKMKISIEAKVSSTHIENDVEYVDDYECVGVTILGKNITEAVANANIMKLSQEPISLEEIKERAEEARVYRYSKTQTTKNLEQSLGGKKMISLESVTKQFINTEYEVLNWNGTTNEVALLSKDKKLCLTKVTEDATGVIKTSEIKEVSSARIGDLTNPITIACSKLFDTQAVSTLSKENEDLKKELDDTKTELSDAKTNLDTLTKTLAEYQTKEEERRKEEVKESIIKRFNEFKHIDNSVDETLYASLITDEKINSYSKCVDANGKFIGSEIACNELNTLFVNKQIETKQKTASQHISTNSLCDVIQGMTETKTETNDTTQSLEEQIKKTISNIPNQRIG